MSVDTKEKERFIDMIRNVPDEVFVEIKDYADYLVGKKHNGLSEFADKIVSEDGEVLHRLAE
jgi:hypothetical protein